MHKPDAQRHHDPLAAPRLIAEAIKVVGSRKALAARVGLSGEALRLLRNGTHHLNYPLQYTLEAIIAEPDRDCPPPDWT